MGKEGGGEDILNQINFHQIEKKTKEIINQKKAKHLLEKKNKKHKGKKSKGKVKGDKGKKYDQRNLLLKLNFDIQKLKDLHEEEQMKEKLQESVQNFFQEKAFFTNYRIHQEEPEHDQFFTKVGLWKDIEAEKQEGREETRLQTD